MQVGGRFAFPRVIPEERGAISDPLEMVRQRECGVLDGFELVAAVIVGQAFAVIGQPGKGDQREQDDEREQDQAEPERLLPQDEPF